MLKVIALGTGVCTNDYAPHTDRWPPGFLVDVDGILILLDCSEGIRYRIHAAGYEYGYIHHVAITHGHPDHAALPQFIQARSCRRIFGDTDHPEFGVFNVYMPKELVKKFPAVWDWHVPENRGKYWFEFTPQFVSMGEGSSVELAPDVRLKSYPVYHGFGRHPSVAYRVETKYGVVAYSGDSGVCDGIVEAGKGADLFICDQSFQIGFKDKDKYGHLTPREAGMVCRRAKPKYVWLTHYRGLDKEKDVIAEIRKAGYKGKVRHAKDGDVWQKR
jgi:ribonuclease BN (tRNA processing enzyme)